MKKEKQPSTCTRMPCLHGDGWMPSWHMRGAAVAKTCAACVSKRFQCNCRMSIGPWPNTTRGATVHHEGRSLATEDPMPFHSNAPASPRMQRANHTCAWRCCKTHAARVAPCMTGPCVQWIDAMSRRNTRRTSIGRCRIMCCKDAKPSHPWCVPGCTRHCQVGGIACFTTPAPLVPLLHRLERMRGRASATTAELHVRATTSCRFVRLPSHVRSFVGNAYCTRKKKQASTKRHERRAHLIANPVLHVLVAWLLAPRRSSAACRHASRLLRGAVPPPSWCVHVRCEGGLLPLRLLPRRCRTAIRSNVRTHLPWPNLRRFVRIGSTETTSWCDAVDCKLHPCHHSCRCVFVHTAMQNESTRNDR